MSEKPTQRRSPAEAFSTESTRQRWEMFHRAIAHAKESNLVAMEDPDSGGSDVETTSSFLTLVR